MRKFGKEKILFALKIILPTLYLATLVFIFSNSLQTGEQSSQTSSGVVDMAQSIFKILAPNSKIATATGEDYLRLHEHIRVLAHFAEFALQGFLLYGCFDRKVKNRIVYVLLLGLATACADEFLQLFADGRAGQIRDVFIDFSGTWRAPGSGFIDASGTWRDPGDGYIDASGAWRDANDGFIDCSDTWREPGEGFIDYSGTWRK